MARALEIQGIATSIISWNRAVTEPIMPPRAVYTKLDRGSVLGRPNDPVQQRRVLEAGIRQLEKDSPAESIRLNESIKTE
jgi:hypothetical protein